MSHIYILRAHCRLSKVRAQLETYIERRKYESSKNKNACFREMTRERNKIRRNERRAPKKKPLWLKCQIWRVEKDDGKERRIPDAKGKKRAEEGRPETRSPSTKNDDESRLDDCKKLQRTSPEVSGEASNVPYLSI